MASLTFPKQILSNVLRSDSVPPSLSQVGWTMLRVIAGLMMIHNGLDKLADIEGFAVAYVEVIGLPFPIFFAYCAAYAELIGAPLLALGFLTRPAALTLFGTMAVAIYHHILVAGFSIPYLELSAVYAACFAFYAINGGGRYSVDALLAGALGSRQAQIDALTQSLETTERISQLSESATKEKVAP